MPRCHGFVMTTTSSELIKEPWLQLRAARHVEFRLGGFDQCRRLRLEPALPNHLRILVLLQFRHVVHVHSTCDCSLKCAFGHLFIGDPRRAEADEVASRDQSAPHEDFHVVVLSCCNAKGCWFLGLGF